MRIRRTSSSSETCLRRPSRFPIPGATLCLWTLLISLAAASLPPQIATREALVQGIEGVRANPESNSALPYGDRNALLFQGFARLRSALAARNQEAAAAESQRILAAADALGDEASLRLVYSE
jgi:hypothetical protein